MKSTEKEEMNSPKVFISYSWSNPTHEQFVLKLAEEIIDNDVDVVLDKWDLKPGNDAYNFMEKMVTDPKINKVIMVVDKVYAEKANKRSGGVGTETQIISSEVYSNQDQDKFVAVVTEKNDQGVPYIPVYYKSRIYMDFCDIENYAENFDQLLRWIWDKPTYKKPKKGKRPAFLNEEPSISLGTSSFQRRALSAIRDGKEGSSGALDEYLNLFSVNLERFRIWDESENGDTEFINTISNNIEQFLQFRNEFLKVVFSIVRYQRNDEYISILHRFFESLLPYLRNQVENTSYKKWDHDNYKFIIHELFLYLIATLVKYERFGQANFFLSRDYFVSGNYRNGISPRVSFLAFNEHMFSFDEYHQSHNKPCFRANVLKERVVGSGLEYLDLKQAGFILFLRSTILQIEDVFSWYPRIMGCGSAWDGPLEVFIRSSSKKYFEKLMMILGVKDKTELDTIMFDFKNDKNPNLPRFGYERMNPSFLMDYDKIASKE